MSRRPNAAANSRGASILAAVAYQKSPSVMVPTDDLATSVKRRRGPAGRGPGP